ncbi:MAG: LCP family protein, partial [bacterium]
MKLNLLDKIDAFKEKTGISEEIFKQHHRRKKFFFIAKLVVSVFLVMVVLLAAFSYQVITSSQSLAKNTGQRPSFFSQLKSLITSDEKPLQGESEQRINFLLLGIGGQDHAGPDLTDTIMIASFIPETKKIAMISLPRDLLVPMEGYGSRKINRINSLGEMKEPSQGAKYAADNISKIFNIPIHYYARVDFTGFVDLINQLGGIKIYVENVIDDKSYPILGKEDVFPYTERFEHLYIEEGWQKMDGELALKYARSRHTQSVEGSDFARSRRQQKIITALKDKAFSFSTLLNPLKLNSLLKTY